MAKKWSLIQQNYYTLLRSRRTGKRWTIALIRKLWDIALDLWEDRKVALHKAEQRPATRDFRQLDRNVVQTFNALLELALPVHDTHLVSLPLADLLNKSLLYKQERLRLATLALASARQHRWHFSTRETRMLKGMQRTLRSWLESTRERRGWEFWVNRLCLIEIFESRSLIGIALSRYQ